MADHRFPVHCRDYATIGALEQLYFEIQFKVLDQLCGCWLRDLQLAGGVLDTSVLPYRHQQSELLEFKASYRAIDNSGMACKQN